MFYIELGYIYAIIITMTETIVVDTSVMISALIGAKGPGREVLRRCLNGNLKPLMSNTLFLEYEDVSRRDRIIKLCPLSDKKIRELLNAFYQVCYWVPIYYLWRPNIKDEGDNFLVELAVAGNASYIVTNNIKDLLSTELTFPSLNIVTPEQLIQGEKHGDYDN